MPKLITVFGATGAQGGSVIKHLLADATLSKEFKIRGITRDTSKPAAQSLAKQGVEVVAADLNSPPSVLSAIENSHTVFLVTNYWETANPADELRQGKTVADAASQAGVSHLIFSSLIDVTEATKGRLSHVPHFDGKAEIERYIKANSSSKDCTFVLPGYFMSNLLTMINKSEDGVFTLAYPVSEDNAKFPLLDTVADLGLFVKAAIKRNESGDGPNASRILAAQDYYSISRILTELEEVAGVKTRFAKLTSEQYVEMLPASIAEEMLENHLLLEEPGYYAGAALEPSLELLDAKPTTWKEFVKKNMDTFK